eukprot:133680-Rhodomonas_salina.2
MAARPPACTPSTPLANFPPLRRPCRGSAVGSARLLIRSGFFPCVLLLHLHSFRQSSPGWKRPVRKGQTTQRVEKYR